MYVDLENLGLGIYEYQVMVANNRSLVAHVSGGQPGATGQVSHNFNAR
jgi:hypothetical protein